MLTILLLVCSRSWPLLTALPYRWSQDLPTVTVMVPVPVGTKARDLIVDIKKQSLRVSRLPASARQGNITNCLINLYHQIQLKNEPVPILEGQLFADIKQEDSTWSLEGGVLSIELEKLA